MFTVFLYCCRCVWCFMKHPSQISYVPDIIPRNFLNNIYFTLIFFTPWTWDKRMHYSEVVKFGCLGYSVSMRGIEQIMYSSDPWYCCLTDFLPAGNTSTLDNMEKVCCTAWQSFYHLFFYYISEWWKRASTESVHMFQRMFTTVIKRYKQQIQSLNPWLNILTSCSVHICNISTQNYCTNLVLPKENPSAGHLALMHKQQEWELFLPSNIAGVNVYS